MGRWSFRLHLHILISWWTWYEPQKYLREKISRAVTWSTHNSFRCSAERWTAQEISCSLSALCFPQEFPRACMPKCNPEPVYCLEIGKGWHCKVVVLLRCWPTSCARAFAFLMYHTPFLQTCLTSVKNNCVNRWPDTSWRTCGISLLWWLPNSWRMTLFCRSWTAQCLWSVSTRLKTGNI